MFDRADQIIADHQRRAEHRRAEAEENLRLHSIRAGGIPSAEYGRLMRLVGFHTLQAHVWINWKNTQHRKGN